MGRAMSELRLVPQPSTATDESVKRPPFDGRGGGGDDGDMERRLSEVEKAIVRIDAMLPNFATKTDIGDAKTLLGH